jgi:hypothetical protein
MKLVALASIVLVATSCTVDRSTPCATSASCAAGVACIEGLCRDGLEVIDLAETCARGADCHPVYGSGAAQLDLLLVIDDSGSMTEEQQSLVTEIPRVIDVLSSGDRDGDGTVDFSPVSSLHVGIVSTDMGTGVVSGVESCSAGFGDDGVMLDHGSTSTGCMPSYPSGIFEFVPTTDDRTQFSTDVGCTASLGNDGCGFEQQLEAALKAVSLAPQADGRSPVSWTAPGYRPPVFFGSTFGHAGAGGLNDGFLRPTSVLAMVVVTDEDDCSVTDPTIFDRTDPRFASVDLNLRCHTFVDALYPVQRYVDGLLGLRVWPELLVFTAITGAPEEAVADGLSYDALLALDEMTERIDPVLHNQLLPSCTAPAGRGVAFPPRRIVQVARGLEAAGAGTSIESICNTSFHRAFDRILQRTGQALAGECLPRAIAVGPDGLVDCEGYAILDEIEGGAGPRRCSELASPEAYELAGVQVESVGGAEVHREVCRVRQVAPADAASSAGWFYDESATSVCDQRISFGLIAPPVSDVVLVCAP